MGPIRQRAASSRGGGEPVSFVCSGCGHQVPLLAPHPFTCPKRTPGDNIDHVLVRTLEHDQVSFPKAPTGNPYVAYSELLSPLYRARMGGVRPAEVFRIIEELDAAITEIDGRGFMPTPWAMVPTLARALGVTGVELWAKDETRNVGGSHKARHLMGVMIHLLLGERMGLTDRKSRPPLAIASCGNAALAAAVVARAADWTLRVFVPADADAAVIARLKALRAVVHECPRDGRPGDPCYRAFQAALAEGALPFSVQGSDNGVAVEGGLTLGYELAEQVRRGPGRIDLLVVQVGGGALASACVAALRDAVVLGVLPKVPRVVTVQTEAAWPLRRAYEQVVARVAKTAGVAPADLRQRADWLRDQPPQAITAALHHAATHRDQYMRPWESVPSSIAHGILDDETYDWWALVDGMIRTGGFPLTVDERTLRRAVEAVGLSTTIGASATGTAGVAGVLAMARTGLLRPREIVASLITGTSRSAA